MGEQVELSVRSQLRKIVDELGAIADASDSVSEGLKQAGVEVGDSMNKQVKQTEGFLGRLRSLSGRVADQMRGDFKSLVALNSIRESLRLSDQFRGTIQQTFELSDSIRKLGGFFGIAASEFGKFQNAMIKGLGEAGLASDVGAKAMEGIAASGAPVTSGSVQGYAVTSGQLGRATRDAGKEADIARLMAQVIQARGGDVNDPKQFGALAQDALKVFNATGASASSTLESMRAIFTGMDSQFRKQITSKGLANLAAAGAVAGPNASLFIQDYLKMSKFERAGMDARGMDKVFGEQGINTEQVAKLYAEAQRLGGGDARVGVRAATGIDSAEAAEGFIRLAESLERVKQVQASVINSNAVLAKQDKATMGFTESFFANVNKVKGWFSDFSDITQTGTDLLSGASESNAGAGAVVAGGAATSALLAGAGMKGAAAVLGGGVSGAAGAVGAAGMSATGVGTAAVGAMAAAEGFKKINEPGALGRMGESMGMGDMLKRLESAITDLGARITGMHSRSSEVKVELNKRDLKESKQPTRGASY